MMERTITIECFESCVYTLAFPQFFENIKLANCRKLFGWLFQFCYKGHNAETIEFLDEALPAFCEEKKAAWHDRSVEFQNGYLSTDRAALPDNLYYLDQIKKEIARRKRRNDKLMSAVKSAKREHEHANKVWKSYTDEKQRFEKT